MTAPVETWFAKLVANISFGVLTSKQAMVFYAVVALFGGVVFSNVALCLLGGGALYFLLSRKDSDS